MYRLTIKDRKPYWSDGSSTYDIIETEHYYCCDTLQQLMGLLEFMVATSEKELDCTIARRESDDE